MGPRRSQAPPAHDGASEDHDGTPEDLAAVSFGCCSPGAAVCARGRSSEPSWKRCGCCGKPRILPDVSRTGTSVSNVGCPCTGTYLVQNLQGFGRRGGALECWHLPPISVKLPPSHFICNGVSIIQILEQSICSGCDPRGRNRMRFHSHQHLYYIAWKTQAGNV